MSESFAELFEESFASQQIKPGSIITGTVVAVRPLSPSISSRTTRAKATSLSGMKSKSHWMPLKTVLVRPSFHERKRSVRVPGLSSRKHSKKVKLSKA
jgi:hypothetical protein